VSTLWASAVRSISIQVRSERRSTALLILIPVSVYIAKKPEWQLGSPRRKFDIRGEERYICPHSSAHTVKKIDIELSPDLGFLKKELEK